MTTIDLTTAHSAISHLRSLPADQAISLPGAHESTTEGDAVRVITGDSANLWAADRNKWEWIAGELVAALESELDDGN
jgi:hypothetical protein